MAFQFPDPSVTPEFTGANGITYIWDGEAWSIKGFRADHDERYVNREGGDDMEGPLQITGNTPHLNLKNGSQIQSDGTEIITMGGSGGFYRGVINNDDHLINKKYVDDALEDLRTVGADYYDSLVFKVPDPAPNTMPLNNVEQNHTWTGGGADGQLWFDIANDGNPYHIGFKAPVHV